VPVGDGAVAALAIAWAGAEVRVLEVVVRLGAAAQAVATALRGPV
jgi:hypothetical protein